MRALENFMNKLSDIDIMWWPFLYLRPQKNEVMTLNYLLKISLYYGGMFGLILGLFLFKADDPIILIFCPISVIILFFVGFSLTFAIAWNSRARRLQKTEKD